MTTQNNFATDDMTTRLILYQNIIRNRSKNFSEICQIAHDTLNATSAAIAFIDEKKSWLPILRIYLQALPRKISRHGSAAIS